MAHTGMMIFKSEIFDNIANKITEIVINLINNDRDDKSTRRDLIKDVLEV